MIHRIVEAFTRPHYQITAMDELVQALTVFAIIGLFVGGFYLGFKLAELYDNYKRKHNRT